MGGELSTDDDGRTWSDREVRVEVERVKKRVQRADLDAVGLGELLGYDLAARFVTGLDALMAAGLRQPQGSVTGDGGRVATRMGNGGLRTSDGHLATRRQGARGVGPGARGSGDGVIRDERALRELDRVRRKIRQLCREVEDSLVGGGSRAGSRCGSCGRWLDKGWKRCPWEAS